MDSVLTEIITLQRQIEESGNTAIMLASQHKEAIDIADHTDTPKKLEM